MSWQYENTHLAIIHNRLNAQSGDMTHLDYAAEMAYKVAVEFEKVIDENFVQDYLDNKLPIGCLSDLFLKSTVLYRPLQETSEDTYMYSYSHKEWLNQLMQAKQTWLWNPASNPQTFQQLMEKYRELQALALSYGNKMEMEH